MKDYEFKMMSSFDKNSNGNSNHKDGDICENLLSPDKSIETSLGFGWEDRKKSAGNGIDNPSSFTIPKDKYHFVFIILLIHGIGVLMPWNSFINANDYFVNFKLAPQGNALPNSSAPDSKGMSEYAKNFISYLGIASQLPNLLLSLINCFTQFKSDTKQRIPYAIVINIVLCIGTVVLAMLDTSSQTGLFFAFTMATVVIMNAATAVYQNCMFGLVAVLPFKYTNALIIGNNLCGTIVSVLNLITIYTSPSIRLSAIWYFIGTMLILIICFDTFYLLPLVIWVMCISVFLTFVCTLCIFPAIAVNIEKSDPNFPMSDKYFHPVFCFLFFNVFAMLGSISTIWIKFPGPRWVWLPIILRLLFIPAYMLCNYRPAFRGTLFPVYFNSDLVYMAFQIGMPFTQGYFTSLCMMYAPSLVDQKVANLAGMLSAVFLVSGLFAGVNLSLLCAYLIEL